MTTLRPLALLTLTLALAATPSFAQLGCFIGDDGFNVGCCATPVPNLPNFPPIQSQAAWACVNNCNINQLQAVVQVSPPNLIFCDYAIAQVTINLLNAAGTPVGIFAGPLLMKYSRTWREPSTTGGRQVWRWLINTDMQWASPTILPTPCLPPEVLPPFLLPVHMNGHIDYACDPTSATGFQSIMSLSRLPNCIQFGPLSQTPNAALAAASQTFHLVAPAPFIFAPFAEPQGVVLEEAVRSSRLGWAPFNYTCQGEADITQGGIQTQFSDCLCATTTPIVGPWKHQNVNAAACCNGAIFPFSNLVLPPALWPLPTGFAAYTLGFWPGAAGGFPGNRQLTVYIGALNYNDPCNPAPASFPIHAVSGVATSNHQVGLFPSTVTPGCTPPTPGLRNNAIDWQNMIPLNQAAAAGANIPGLGALFVSTLVWNLNV